MVKKERRVHLMMNKERRVHSLRMNKKGQLKIQEMAFVLIAIVIFFSLVALVYMSIRMSSLRGDVAAQREEEAKNLVSKLADTPELSWVGCETGGCIDTDKAIVLKDKNAYRGFWNLDFLMIEWVYKEEINTTHVDSNLISGQPSGVNKTIVECTSANFPDCNQLTIIGNKDYGTPVYSYVALCRYDGVNNYEKCELGRLFASGKAVA